MTLAYPARHRERASRRALIVAGAVGLSVGLLFGSIGPLGGATSTQSDGARASAGPAATSNGPGAAPTRHLVDGAPAGFPHTQEGAVAAAASFVCTGQALTDMDPLAADEAVRQMAAQATSDAQVRQTRDQLDGARQALAKGTGPIVFRQAALAWRVDGYTDDRARVLVWNVGVLSRQGIAPPQASWSTSTFDLVWERDDWHIWSESVTPGPAPLLDNSTAPATSAQLTTALDGFTDFGSSR